MFADRDSCLRFNSLFEAIVAVDETFLWLQVVRWSLGVRLVSLLLVVSLDLSIRLAKLRFQLCKVQSVSFRQLVV